MALRILERQGCVIRDPELENIGEKAYVLTEEMWRGRCTMPKAPHAVECSQPRSYRIPPTIRPRHFDPFYGP
jgi:hypothetical protein